MIVQTWRGNVWKKDDLDSILTLVFTNTPKGGQLIWCIRLHPTNLLSYGSKSIGNLLEISKEETRLG